MIFELDHFLFPFFVISVYIFFAFALPPSKFILPDINILKHSRQQVDGKHVFEIYFFENIYYEY